MHPVDRILTIRVLESGGAFGIRRILEARERVAVTVFPGMEIDFDLVFERGAEPSV